MRVTRHGLFLLGCVVGLPLMACAAEVADLSAGPGEESGDLPAGGLASPGPADGDFFAQSQCGPTWDAQPVENYNGDGGVTNSFVAYHETRVGYHVRAGCTGTLVSDDLFLSAGHCGYVLGDVVRFNYQDSPTGMARPTTDVLVIEIVEQEFNENWDYALVRLSGSPGRELGHANLAAVDPPTDSTVTLIGHPAGRPKEVHAGPVLALVPAQGHNWFSYWVDTEGGSSGSGVLDEAGRLIGVHTNGGCFLGSPPAGNSGMRMSQLVLHSPALATLTRNRILWRHLENPFVSLWTVAASGALLDATGFTAGASWMPLTYSNNRMTWRHVDGRVSVWRLNQQNQVISTVESGPFPPWQAVSAANDRILWRDTVTGNIVLWSVDTDGNFLSAVNHTVSAGWEPINYANNHILWRHSSGQVSLWRLDDAGNFLASSPAFSYGPGWDPISYENGQLLWRHTDGRVSVWNHARDNSLLDTQDSTPASGWTPLAMSDRKLGWRHTSGLFSLWNVSSNGTFLGHLAHSVGLDWNLISIAGARPW